MFNAAVKYFFSVVFLISVFVGQAQTALIPPKPKLVVGIVVDQMAYEFLYRYQDAYGAGGFKKLLKGGYSCENTNYSYIPTYTGPGHASIYTGSVPAINGIVSNDWYDKSINQFMYVTSDSSVRGVGTISPLSNQSPRNMLTTTIGDMLKLSDQQHSKVIGLALKDRGAILPAGHSANSWVTSTFYMDSLPKWVQDFNATKPAEKYLNQNWNLYLPKESYRNATADSVSWEAVNIGEPGSQFPHYLNFTGNSEIIKGTPFGNSITKEFAEAIIKNEKMGKGNYTDFLCLSFSSTDYVGHGYGPHSMETEDTYLRLDNDLSEFISYLDANIGKDNYLLFLTADHGVSPVPQYLQSLKIPAGTKTELQMTADMEAYLDKELGNQNWIITYTNQQVYLNEALLDSMKMEKEEIFGHLKKYVLQMDGIANIFLIDDISNFSYPAELKEKMINGIYPKRSGDIQIVYEPYWFDAYRPTGTTHGSHYAYDTHVPLVWYGWKIKPGVNYSEVFVTDIAPTLAAFLKISEPNGCVGNVIEGLMK
jgi:predicted AlkP superfamily pyrophosphatase or phosphodiesterase